MVELRYRIVDVFTDRPLAGNALCVVLDPCPEPVMRAIAREVNLSETSFPVVTGERSYDVRIFTPDAELPFAGHPSLGTAWVLGAGRWEQTSPGATVVVEATADGAVMSQPDPRFSEVDPGPVLPAIGLHGFEGAWLAEAAGARHMLVLTDAPIERLTPDPTTLAAAVHNGEQAIAVVRRLDGATLHARVFLPHLGIPEDPGTGSTAGPIAVLARRTWGTAEDVTILQGAEIGRPSRLQVHAEEGAVRVGGSVVACAEGRFTL